jgi:cobyrinic acid a,c-diamide synthase
MKVSRQRVAQKIIDYLNHRITLADLVDWAESAMMEADFEERDVELLRDIIGRIGLADVRAFGMTWEDWEDFLSRLGYRISITVSEAPVLAEP